MVERYNFIHENTQECELNIILGQISEIDIDLKALTDDFTWINYGRSRSELLIFGINSHNLLSDEVCIRKIHDKIARLHKRVTRTHENIENILKSIEIWGSQPMYQRKDNNAKALLNIEDRSLKFKRRTIEVINSKFLIEYAMEENYRLFNDLPLQRPMEESSVGKERLRKTVMRHLEMSSPRDTSSYRTMVTVKQTQEALLFYS